MNKGQKHFVLHFNVSFSTAKHNIKIFSENIEPYSQVSQNPENITYYFKEFDKEAVIKDKYSAKIQDTILETMFWKILRNFQEKDLSENFRLISKHFHFKNRLYKLFESKFKENICVELIAKHMGMSKRNLEYNCQSLLGSSPAKLFASYRMQKASTLLINTDLNIQEICYELGYKNPFNFSRTFKGHFGKSPDIYRKT